MTTVPTRAHILHLITHYPCKVLRSVEYCKQLLAALDERVRESHNVGELHGSLESDPDPVLLRQVHVRRELCHLLCTPRIADDHAKLIDGSIFLSAVRRMIDGLTQSGHLRVLHCRCSH